MHFIYLVESIYENTFVSQSHLHFMAIFKYHITDTWP